jgi:hypothetical protein
MPREGRRVKGDADERAQARRRLRTELLAAARALAIENDGYEAVTIRAVADRVGYRAPVVYEHFANKRALLLAIVDAGCTPPPHVMPTPRPICSGRIYTDWSCSLDGRIKGGPDRAHGLLKHLTTTFAANAHAEAATEP